MAMTYATILALADGGPTSDAVLNAAVRLGRQFRAQLEVVHLKADPSSLVPVVGEGMSGALIEQMIDSMTRMLETRAKQARDAYDRVVAPSGVTATWREISGPGPENLATAGRFADLTILARPAGEDSVTQSAVLDAAVFDTGRPVMIVPAGSAAAIGERVAIAWNGSAYSAHAVSGAMPLLKAAKQVTIVAVGEDDKAAPAAALASYLARHDVAAAVARTDLGHQSVGHAILERTAALGADLLVMGGYGHSRLREMILGGATRHVLNNATLAVLMAH
jgi:nucleotide-binding universal stress UspA family protein